MIFIYLVIGIFTSVISALPLGASNIAVINITLKQNAKQAFKIAITAGIAEVILSYYALEYNMVVKDFFDENLWVQSTIAILLLIIGLYLFFKKHSEPKPKRLKLVESKYTAGFILGLINPPVLIYWVVAFGVINNNDIMLSLKSSFSVLFLFFSGVYIGKLLTLFAYSKISLIIKKRIENINSVINKTTGTLLIVIGIIQSAQLYFS